MDIKGHRNLLRWWIPLKPSGGLLDDLFCNIKNYRIKSSTYTLTPLNTDSFSGSGIRYYSLYWTYPSPVNKVPVTVLQQIQIPVTTLTLVSLKTTDGNGVTRWVNRRPMSVGLSPVDRWVPLTLAYLPCKGWVDGFRGRLVDLSDLVLTRSTQSTPSRDFFSTFQLPRYVKLALLVRGESQTRDERMSLMLLYTFE